MIQDPEVVDNCNKNMFSRQNRAVIHMNLQRLWQHAQDLNNIKPDKNPSREADNCHKVSPITS